MMKVSVLKVAALTLLSTVAASVAMAADLPHPPHQIPHPIEGYVPITGSMNMCAMCHREVGKAAAPNLSLPVYNVPESHYKADGTLNGARNNCVMCHAPMTEFSSFKPRALNDRPTE